MTEQIFSRVKSCMNSQSYFVNDSWLRDCIEYFCSENSQVNFNNVQQFVKEQFLLSDLREINNINGCLPPNLSEKPKTILDSKYTLQLLKLYDISMSKYKQLEKIRNVSTVNIDVTNENNSQPWEPVGKRMLQLFLTDGIQEILAIEYKPIRILNDSLLPGLKIMIMGPVVCRKGVILLEETNVAIREGEVADLLIPNALENVLANALNLPINEDPYNDKNKKEIATTTTIVNDFGDDDFNVDFDEIERSVELAQSKLLKETNNTNKNYQQSLNINNKNISKFNDNTMRNQPSPQQQTKNENQIIFNNCDFHDNDDDDVIFDDLEIDEGFSSHNNQNSIKESPIIAKNITEPTPSSSKAFDIPDDDFDFNEVDFDSGFTWTEPVPALKNEVTSNSGKTVENIKREQNITGGNGLQKVITGSKRSSAQLSPVTSTTKIHCLESATTKSATSNRKITDFIGNSSKTTKRDDCPMKVCDFISEILTINLTEQPIRRRIRAKVTTIGKLTKKNGLWILYGTIIDQSGKLDVDFSSQFMENILGFSANEFSEKKKEMKLNPELLEPMRKKMLEGQTKLGEMNCLMELEMKKNVKPLVLSYSELSETQINAHNKRFKFL
ncbi:recQ-mediated genome instability protein 1-like [Leptopilina boulardi]|uniref:recQ-mediated genome instability protein 1-like n=1 Tax=Leptopilina boulardi TaxID=63433 RepID=UPI0021F690F5|nr:recQ-mediated genome instability protein 1-like [Leptopilina boulardi]